MHCFTAEKLFRFEAIADLDTIPLPLPEGGLHFSSSNAPSVSLTSKRGNGGTFGELLRAVTLW